MQQTNKLIIAYLLHLKQQNLAIDNDSLDVAIGCLKDVFHENPQSSSELLDIVEKTVQSQIPSSSELKNQANEAMKAKDYVKSENLYSQAIEQSQRKGEAPTERAVFYANRAQCRKLNNQTQMAIDDLKQCVELNPNYQKGWLRLAQIYEEQGKKDAAYQIFVQEDKKASNEQTQEGLKRTQPQQPGQMPFNKEEMLQKFPMLKEALDDPEVQALLQKPSVREKMEKVQQNPMMAMSLMTDPELQPLFKAFMSKLGPMMQGMGGMFGNMFGGNNGQGGQGGQDVQ